MTTVDAPDFQLSTFKLEKVINCDYNHKLVTLLGGFSCDEYKEKAVVVLYKDSFNPETIDYEEVLKSVTGAECVHNVRI